ncbi:UNVERIFIED_CONTAM: protein NRT1/ PTR FAMILY 2.7 [Sesamum angustifolium]|uniref:Protein NRT1/ PTR FAMILY 2.7 n=1 Tax=Sesamum angustifolium TaxID=2727405 RepID=A0AAW2QPK6_9LAMI
MAGLTLAAGGWIANLIVYLIQEFNIKSVSAAKIYNVVNGSITMFPIIGAILADSFVGCFSVIWFSSLISLLGTLLLVLTGSNQSLETSIVRRRVECVQISISSSVCSLISRFSTGVSGKRRHSFHHRTNGSRSIQ